MNPQEQNPQTDQGVQVHNPLSVMQAGEQNICEIKRHPIGLLGMFVGSGLLLVVLAVVCFGVLPRVMTTNHTRAYEIGALVFIVLALFTSIFVFITNKVYWGNRWILTSDSLTQVSQNSLFDKQSSQLSLGNLEDVTAQQDGILAHMFHFGVIRVETAGERSKFVFAYCPSPEHYAQQILGAREAFEQGRRAGAEQQQLYRGQPSYMPPADANVTAQPALGPVQTPYNPPPYDPPIDPGVNTNTES